MKPQKKVLVLKAPLTWILIDEDRDSEQAKEEWLLNREIRLNGPVDKKGKWKLHNHRKNKIRTNNPCQYGVPKREGWKPAEGNTLGAYITPPENGNYQMEVKGFLGSALIGLDKIHENSEPKHNISPY